MSRAVDGCKLIVPAHLALAVVMAGAGWSSAKASEVIQVPKSLGSFGAWRALAIGDGPTKVCYLVSYPGRAAPADMRHGDVYVMVTNRPADRISGEFSFFTGYRFRRGSDVSLKIDKNKAYALFTEQESAWTYKPEDDIALSAEMRKGSQMMVEAITTRDVKASYSFSLSGVSKALDTVTKACPPPPPKKAEEPTKVEAPLLNVPGMKR